ncbi:MAG: carbon-nitrogen hydrolase [Planctomycetaceae bacterium]|jgi:predicted amidohydrolase|nr:carbon-nitrogen hydrolase [Planctomycetaceae bacterium]MDP7277765.1 carbon-nitrogen hydrolase family protein [Planctomycetaceae bacterium]
MQSLRVATCQFPVEADIAGNLRFTLRQIRRAAEQGARVVHFSECALSGYAGVEFPDMSHLDWDQLVTATGDIQQATRDAGVWVVLGSTHRLSGRHKPHNCLYVINPEGQIVDRYDKRFCTGTGGRRPTMDLSHYAPGNRPVTFTVDGITCGILICYDYRFPELYREYCKLGVKVLLQSFHNARSTVVDDQDYNIWRTIVPSTMSCRAAENHMWISANNSTARPSRWPSFAVRPDGQVVGRLSLHRPGVLVTEMVLDPDLFDAPGPWRERVIAGTLHSGTLVADPRSSDVTCL